MIIVLSTDGSSSKRLKLCCTAELEVEKMHVSVARWQQQSTPELCVASHDGMTKNRKRANDLQSPAIPGGGALPPKIQSCLLAPRPPIKRCYFLELLQILLYPQDNLSPVPYHAPVSRA